MKPEIVSAIIILTFAAYIDWKEKRVPNWLTFTAFGGGVLFHAIPGFGENIGWSLLGATVGLGTLLIPYALNGMGAGDVKLMAAVGAWVGPMVTLGAFFWIAVIGGVMGLIGMLRSGRVRERIFCMSMAGKNMMLMRNLDVDTPDDKPHKVLLPYGVPIAFGFYAYFLFGGLL